MAKAIITGHDKIGRDLNLKAGKFDDALNYCGGDKGYEALAELTPAQTNTIVKLSMGWVHWYIEVEEDGSARIILSP